MDVSSVCRICLKLLQNGSSYNLFLVPGLAKKLSMCTTLSVEPQDGFPNNICGACNTRLSDMAEFQELCIESVKKFKEMMTNNIVRTTPAFDMMKAPSTAPIEGVQIPDDEDEHLNFDPLRNNKMEIENEEDIFKMLESVDKEEEEGAPNSDEEEFPSIDSRDNDVDNDDDVQFQDPPGSGKDDGSGSDSDDDKPLASRIRMLNKEIKEKNDKTSAPVTKEPKVYPKRKRVPRSKRHFECHICHQKYKKKKTYEEHMKFHNDNLPFQCEVDTCKKGFTTAYGLRIHVEHSHEEIVEKIPCTEEGCDMKFSSRRTRTYHLKEVHKLTKEDIPNLYPCKYCEKVFKGNMSLKKHTFKHTGQELPYPCNICGKRFVINSALKYHLMRHAGIKNYVCPYCGVGKTTRQEWNKHIAIHSAEKMFKCHLCPHATRDKNLLRKHIRVVHDKIKDYACQYCDKQFGKSDACKVHEMTHTGEKKYVCKLCGRGFPYPKKLTQHLKTHEKHALRAKPVRKKGQLVKLRKVPADDAEVLSNIADSENTQESRQNADEILKMCADSVNSMPKDPRRVERVDIADLAGTAVNPIAQVVLPSWSPKLNSLKKEGKLTCPDCGKEFNFLSYLKLHHKIVHQGVKDFVCRYCQKRFAKAQWLKHHEMTHTGEKPHACTHCDMRFIQVVGLKRHMKVHQERPTNIPQAAFKAKEGRSKNYIKQPIYITQDALKAKEELVEQERKKCEQQKKSEAMADEARKQLEELKRQEEDQQQSKSEALVNIPIPKKRLPPVAVISKSRPVRAKFKNGKV